MSNRLRKTKQKNNKINKTINNDYYIFDFKYITTNKKYNFKFFKEEKSNKNEAYDELIKRIYSISNYTTDKFLLLGKQQGLETIKYHQLNFQPNGLDISADDKFISIRFNKDKYRIICIKSVKYKNVLHIIGFDFNFSAYKH